MSYLVASMPAMFFVAGSLMAHSLEKAGARHVLYTRFRRLLIPFWAFGVVAMGIMVSHAAIRGAPGEEVAPQQVIFWLFPIWDPQGSDWGVTWWAVLWYMRGLAWLILLSPLLLWLFRRVSFTLLALPLGFLAYFEYLRRAGTPVPWQFEDLALFGIFWLLGYCHNAGLFTRLTAPTRAGAAMVAIAATVAWVTTQDVPNMVVNASYPAHLFVGVAWLFAALALEGPLTAFASRGLPARFIAQVNDRAFTIYLWHAAGLFAMYQLLWVEPHSWWLREVGTLPIVVIVTSACILGFGWLEDLAARRHLHVAPEAPGFAHAAQARNGVRSESLLAAAAILGAVVLFGATLVDVLDRSADAASARAVPPSGIGLTIRTARAEILDTPPLLAAAEPAAALLTESELQAVIDGWLAENAIAGVAVGIRRADGSSWAGSAGRDVEHGGGIAPDRVFPIASVTKTFTAALVMQLVDQGKLTLDDPLSRFVPDFPHSRDITVRNLIQHTSGIMSTDGVPPAEALREAAEESLQFEPGTEFEYSTPGYFLLALIVEKVLDRPFTSALHEYLLDPLGLSDTHMDEELDPLPYSTHPVVKPALRSSSGVLRSSSGLRTAATTQLEYHGTLWSSAGLYSTVSDLARWAIGLWDGTGVVTAESREQMTTFLGAEFEFTGLGTYPFCPCWNEGGRLRAERWGHLGRYGVIEYDPRDRVALAIYTSNTDLDERIIVAYDKLSERLRDTVRGRPLPPVARVAGAQSIGPPSPPQETTPEPHE